MGKMIYSTRDLKDATSEMLKGVNKALVAAAYKICDDMKEEFKKAQSQYKYGTKDYYKLAEGIMVGKLENGSIKIHALGHRENDDLWKARFFVGGTSYRKNSKGDKGYIKENDAVDKGMKNGENILNNYINNALNK